MRQNPFNDDEAAWELPPRGDRVFSIRISRNTAIALALSLLLHAAVLWFFAPKMFSMGEPAKNSPPFEVSLAPPQPAEIAPSEPAPPALPEPLPEPIKPKSTKPKPLNTKPQKSTPPKQIEPPQPAEPIETPVAVAKNSDLAVPKPSLPKPPPIDKNLPPKVPSAEATPEPLPGEDMQAYIKRQKEAKLAAQGASKQDTQEVLASNNPQSAGEKRDAKIKENLKFDGTNGVFQVRELSLRGAQFSFKGWKNNVNTARLEIIEVSVPDAQDTADVQRAVIRKMIEIIRREYSGDFNWVSQRLDRVLVLSARQQDNDALEDFMMTEFFGSGTRLR